MYNGCGAACCWRGDDEDEEEDDIDDDDEADDVGEGLSQLSSDRSPCKDLLKEAGRVGEDVSSEMSWQDTDGDYGKENKENRMFMS